MEELLGSQQRQQIEDKPNDQRHNNNNNDTTTSSTSPPPSTLSKNKLRKLRHHEQVLNSRKHHRTKERLSRKLRGLGNGKGNDEKLAEREKLKDALDHGPQLVIDCQYQNHMSLKEKTRFAQQLRRVYSSNRNADTPFHLYVTSLRTDSELYRVCCEKNDGFERYLIDVRGESVSDLLVHHNFCGKKEVVYLSPDADEVIDLKKGFDVDNYVYCIGGLVDETTNKNLSKGVAAQSGFKCVRLPIDEFFEVPTQGGIGKKVLTINQVFDIIVEWVRTKDWVAALSKGLAQRCGFKVKQQS